ncbi:MAG: hypothetical protein SF052_13575 [Bacteroidia bacterium]|nr:hypothetical protein [Bacteroidia bacterium]
MKRIIQTTALLLLGLALTSAVGQPSANAQQIPVQHPSDEGEPGGKKTEKPAKEQKPEGNKLPAPPAKKPPEEKPLSKEAKEEILKRHALLIVPFLVEVDVPN